MRSVSEEFFRGYHTPMVGLCSNWTSFTSHDWRKTEVLRAMWTTCGQNLGFPNKLWKNHWILDTKCLRRAYSAEYHARYFRCHLDVIPLVPPLLDATSMPWLDVVTSHRKTRRTAEFFLFPSWTNATQCRAAAESPRVRVINRPKPPSACKGVASTCQNSVMRQKKCCQHAKATFSDRTNVFQNTQKDVSREDLCCQHAKSRFAMEKRAVNRHMAIEKNTTSTCSVERVK